MNDPLVRLPARARRVPRRQRQLTPAPPIAPVPVPRGQVFDKAFYVDLREKSWRPRNRGGPANGGPPQDFAAGDGADGLRMMLNTDVCLAFDIGAGADCCTGPGEVARNAEVVGDDGEPREMFPLGACRGDCDTDEECQVSPSDYQIV